MPINITFDYVSSHTLVKAGGIINYAPALPHAGRLYVIRNALAHGHPYYIGTASNVQNRFTPRSDAVRELGFRTAEINNISIAIVQITVNGYFNPPDDHGISNGVDVEHLLIRLYVVNNEGVRNIVKITPFFNTTGLRINYTFVNSIAWPHFMPHNYFINNGYNL